MTIVIHYDYYECWLSWCRWLTLKYMSIRFAIVAVCLSPNCYFPSSWAPQARSEAWEVYPWELYPLDNPPRPSRPKAGLGLVMMMMTMMMTMMMITCTEGFGSLATENRASPCWPPCSSSSWCLWQWWWQGPPCPSLSWWLWRWWWHGPPWTSSWWWLWQWWFDQEASELGDPKPGNQPWRKGRYSVCSWLDENEIDLIKDWNYRHLFKHNTTSQSCVATSSS